MVDEIVLQTVADGKAARKRAYRIANQEKARVRRQQYRKENRQLVLERERLQHQANKAKRNAASKTYYANNKGKLLAMCEEWRKNNREAWNAYMRVYVANRKANDPSFRIRINLRSRVHGAIHRDFRKVSAIRDLGCSIDEFKSYIEAHWSPGMTWENWGNGNGCWSLDHIRPLASFDLTDREQFLAACHYTNYQPLWATDNIRKGAKWDG